MRTGWLIAWAAATVLMAGAGAGHAARYLVLSEAEETPSGLERRLALTGGEVIANLDQIGVLVVEGDRAFAEWAQGLASVRAVVPDRELVLLDDFRVAGEISLGEAGSEAPLGVRDPLAALQWPLLAIDAPSAWGRGATGGGVRVAVLDDGADATHPGLAANLDVALSTSFIADETFDGPPGRHGTHVAGIIAAASSGVGTVGVAPDAEVIAIKAVSARTDTGTFATVLQGIVYAAEIGVDILHLSVAVRGGLDAADAGIRGALAATQRALDYAHGKGVTIVVPAGNDAREAGEGGGRFAYPADFDHVIAVASTGPVGWGLDPSVSLTNLASYSSSLEAVRSFAAAPGGDFLYPGAESCSGLPCWWLDMVLSTVPSGWGWSAGTAMAAAHVTGVAALVISAFDEPMDPQDVEAALRLGSGDLGGPVTGGRAGHGRINAAAAIER